MKKLKIQMKIRSLKVVNECEGLRMLFQEIVNKNVSIAKPKIFEYFIEKYKKTDQESVLKDELDRNCDAY